jgi:hypothetical protein
MATNDEPGSDETPAAKPEGPPAPGIRRRGRRGGRGRGRGPGRPRPAGLTADALPARAIETAPDVAPDAAVAVARETAAPIRVERGPQRSAIGKAIDEVTQIAESLKHVLDQMEEVLELVELAERQQIGDEREIESLRRALHQLQGPRGGAPRSRPPGP